MTSFLVLIATTRGFTQDSPVRKVLHGVATTQDDCPLAGATIELLDVSGIVVAKTRTGADGRFEIETYALPGQYELIVTDSGQLNEEQIRLGRTDLSIKVVSSGTQAAILDRSGYTVSARQLGIAPKHRARIAAAQQKFEQGKLSEALQELEAVMENCPSCSEAWSMRAFMRLSMNDITASIADGLHAVELDPRNAGAYLAVGSAYNSQHEFILAEGPLRHALQLQPDSWQAQLELAKAWYGQKKLVLALRQLDLIAHDFPDVHLVRANVLISLGRKSEGAAEFATFLRQAPTDKRAPQIQRIIAEIAHN